MQKSIKTTLLAMIVLAIAGCESSDQRLARMAQETTRQQAQQNERLAEQHNHIAQASRQLVEADAQARAEFQQLSQDLQQQRSQVDRQREELDEERKQIATARLRDPVIASAVLQIGLALLCVLPLLVCIYVLRAVTHAPVDDSSQALTELLVLDVTSDQPLLVPRLESLRTTPCLDENRRMGGQPEGG